MAPAKHAQPTWYQHTQEHASVYHVEPDLNRTQHKLVVSFADQDSSLMAMVSARSVH